MSRRFLANEKRKRSVSLEPLRANLSASGPGVEPVTVEKASIKSRLLYPVHML